ncbi:MAG: sigma-70 family RNA polymerase sigma factor, partial [Planctomycetes bacterium]|nr:sigma-70 family RNA polymerase sigma factor [Planctomycetota bacterium]
MTDETIEQFFRRFQVERDPAAMAAVFDRVAPRLLLLAAHVTPDPAAAEDLLQETFLQAIARAEQWDPSRPLLPWLGGVLRHRAQDLARRSALRRPAARLDEVVASATGPGPRQAAETAELLDRVEQALAGLESPYREALVLRVVHGLEPAAIAHALGRPPATVRTQLRRGLERLRGALP